eukprot:5885030-Amphidinium_carterae.2
MSSRLNKQAGPDRQESLTAPRTPFGARRDLQGGRNQCRQNVEPKVNKLFSATPPNVWPRRGPKE